MRWLFNWVLLVALTFFFTLASRSAPTAESASLHADGWTITADLAAASLRISQDKLGTVIEDAHLYLGGEHGLIPLKNWSIERTVPAQLGEEARHQLFIRTAHPSSAWLIETGVNSLKISSTSAEACLTGRAPAPASRIVARPLDPAGVPVTWAGTDPIAEQWHGRQTRNPSFLPSRNPECLYASLGQVSASNLHSLFDRKTDTLIAFSERAIMRRALQDPDILDLQIPVPGNTVVRLIPNYYTQTLRVPFYTPVDEAHFPKAPAVWGSWTSYYEVVTEDDVVRNADWIGDNLKAYGVDYVLLDDGYDRGPKGEHAWIGPWDKSQFPHGPKWLADRIKSKGLHAGLWLVPNSYAGAVSDHPDWYLRDKAGAFVMDYRTPALDHTNPEVLGFLKTLFTTLDSWGFDYYKLDGEFSLPDGDPQVDRGRLYDQTIDPVSAYRNRLKLIRETVGPKALLEGCPEGAPLYGTEYFTAYWNGFDDSNSWQGAYKLFTSINDNAFLNHIVTYLFPGEGVDVAPHLSFEEAARTRYAGFLKKEETRKHSLARGDAAGFGNSLEEARTMASFVSLTGVVYSIASVMPGLPEERVDLLRQTLPTMPIMPIDLFSRGTNMHYWLNPELDTYIHNLPEIVDLKVNAKSGVYDVTALTNWRDEPAAREISFGDKLGLDASSRYVVFDFWKQEMLGVFQGGIRVEIRPHDTRVLQIHPLLDRPQLVGNSRHITGAYSILDLSWNAADNRLSGSSQAEPGRPYTLWIHVPEGYAVSGLRAAAEGQGEVPLRQARSGDSLKITFPGQSAAVHWAVNFTSPRRP